MDSKTADLSLSLVDESPIRQSDSIYIVFPDRQWNHSIEIIGKFRVVPVRTVHLPLNTATTRQ